MTNDPYQRFLDDYGRELERAAARPLRRHRSVAALGIAVAVAATAIIVVLLAAPGGDRRLDVVAQARAALSDRGRLVHLVVRQSIEVRPRYPREKVVVPPPTTTEQWSASDPPRWRIAFSYPDPKTTPGAGTVGDAHGPIVGPVQFAYANGAQFTYLQERNTLTIVRGFSDTGPAAEVPGPTPLGNDPIATIRSMLTRGELRDDGQATVDGHAVRRLVGERQRTFGKQTVTSAMEYDVDPDSFSPVAARVELPLRAPRTGTAPPPTTLVLRFLDFQRLPFTKDNARLLKIQPVGHPRVIEKTAKQARAEARRRGPRRAPHR
jgi:hypothetical protein